MAHQSSVGPTRAKQTKEDERRETLRLRLPAWLWLTFIPRTFDEYRGSEGDKREARCDTQPSTGLPAFGGRSGVQWVKGVTGRLLS
jgi:hypothetical protein